MNVTKAVGLAAVGKTVIDVSNAVTRNMKLAIGFTTSAAEEIQKLLLKAHVLKALNIIFAKNQSTGRIYNEKLTLFVAGDGAETK